MLESITPSDDFTNTPDTARITKAVYVAADADGDSLTVTCNKSGSAITFVTGGQIWPVRTRAALGNTTGYTVVYFY